MDAAIQLTHDLQVEKPKEALAAGGEGKRLSSEGQEGQAKKGGGASQPPPPPSNLVRQAEGLKPTSGGGQPPLPSKTMV